MRIEPEDEMLLMAERAMLRFICNWFWPLLMLGNIMWDAMHFEEWTTFNFVWAAIWYPAAIHFWKKDFAKLRSVRAKIEEAHR